MVKIVWAFIYRRWLWNDFYQEYDSVEKVLGWRTARVKNKSGAIKCMTPCFKLFWIDFN